MHQKHCRHGHVLRIIKNLKHMFFRFAQPRSDQRAVHGQHPHLEPKHPQNRNPEIPNRHNPNNPHNRRP